MGFCYDTISLGYFDGFDIALDSDMDIYNYVRKVDLGAKAPEYYIGFGSGFDKGKEKRNLLSELNIGISLTDKIKYYKYLIQKERYPPQKKFSDTYLHHAQSWTKRNIPEDIKLQSKDLLAKGNLQRAIQTILIFCRENYFLVAWIELENFYIELDNIRIDKRNGEILSDDAIESKKDISGRLIEWMDRKHS